MFKVTSILLYLYALNSLYIYQMDIIPVYLKDFIFFYSFLEPHLWHMEAPRVGVTTEL